MSNFNLMLTNPTISKLRMVLDGIQGITLIQSTIIMQIAKKETC